MSRASELRAVLFDMDGTLVETEQYWGEAMFELAARWAAGMSAEAARGATIGASMRVSMSVLHADLGLRRSEEQLQADARWVEDRTAALMASRHLLAAGRAPSCCATSAAPAWPPRWSPRRRGGSRPSCWPRSRRPGRGPVRRHRLRRRGAGPQARSRALPAGDGRRSAWIRASAS